MSCVVTSVVHDACGASLSGTAVVGNTVRFSWRPRGPDGRPWVPISNSAVLTDPLGEQVPYPVNSVDERIWFDFTPAIAGRWCAIVESEGEFSFAAQRCIEVSPLEVDDGGLVDRFDRPVADRDGDVVIV